MSRYNTVNRTFKLNETHFLLPQMANSLLETHLASLLESTYIKTCLLSSINEYFKNQLDV